MRQSLEDDYWKPPEKGHNQIISGHDIDYVLQPTHIGLKLTYGILAYHISQWNMWWVYHFSIDEMNPTSVDEGIVRHDIVIKLPVATET